MKNLKPLLFITLFLPAMLWGQQNILPSFDTLFSLNKAYFSGLPTDTLTFSPEKSYKACYLQLTGSDIDEDRDGDYTEFLFAINSTRILDTTEIANVTGFGKDGALGDAFLDITDMVKPGENQIMLNNTEGPEQTDYAVIKDIYILCTDRDFSHELELEKKYMDEEGYDKSIDIAFNLANNETGTYKKKFYSGNEYLLVASSYDQNLKLQISVYDGEEMLYRKVGKNVVELNFKQDDDAQYVVKVKVIDAPDTNKHPVVFYVFYK